LVAAFKQPEDIFFFPFTNDLQMKQQLTGGFIAGELVIGWGGSSSLFSRRKYRNKETFGGVSLVKRGNGKMHLAN